MAEDHSRQRLAIILERNHSAHSRKRSSEKLQHWLSGIWSLLSMAVPDLLIVTRPPNLSTIELEVFRFEKRQWSGGLQHGCIRLGTDFMAASRNRNGLTRLMQHLVMNPPADNILATRLAAG